jgi:hypothetical protein
MRDARSFAAGVDCGWRFGGAATCERKRESPAARFDLFSAVLTSRVCEIRRGLGQGSDVAADLVRTGPSGLQGAEELPRQLFPIVNWSSAGHTQT